MSDKEKMIELRGISQMHPMSAINFLTEYAEKIKEGYVLHPKPTGRLIPRFTGYPFCVMVTEEYAKELMQSDVEVKQPEEKGVVEVSQEADVDTSIVEKIKQTKTKADLIELAAEIGVEIPEDKKVPKAIQQFLINAVSK